MHPAIGKILRGFPALKSYFTSLGDNCPVALGKYFNENHAKKTECFLGFLDNTLKIFLLTEQSVLFNDLYCVKKLKTIILLILFQILNKTDKNDKNCFSFDFVNL